MNNTWIKIYRKIVDHDVFRDDSAFKVFIWILCSADYRTGKMISGRFWGASILGIKDTTYYGILKRLEKKYNLLTLSSNNKNTIILVNNWDKYQSDDDNKTDNKLTTNRQQTDTNQELRIKNIYTSNESLIFSYFENLEESNQKIVDIAKEFDIRPKDVIWCIRDMLSKSSEKNIEIKNVKLKLNTWINNATRWHKVATLTAKGENKKPLTLEEWYLKNEGITLIESKQTPEEVKKYQEELERKANALREKTIK